MLRILVVVSVIALSQAGNLLNGGLGLGLGLRGGYGYEGAYAGNYGANYGGYAGNYGGDYAGGYAGGYAAPIPHAFAYSAQGHDGGSTREESSDGHGGVRGSYTLNVADGRQRTVNYVADHAGFRAEINTNEPGTETKHESPANTLLISAQPPAAELAYRTTGYGSGYGSAPILAAHGNIGLAGAPFTGYNSAEIHAPISRHGY